jgi:hypothetical protein
VVEHRPTASLEPSSELAQQMVVGKFRGRHWNLGGEQPADQIAGDPDLGGQRDLFVAGEPGRLHAGCSEAVIDCLEERGYYQHPMCGL